MPDLKKITKRINLFSIFFLWFICYGKLLYAQNPKPITLQVYVNNNLVKSYVKDAINTQLNPLNLKMGDHIKFKFINIPVTSSTPVIKGVPQVWIARSAGEVLYYCSPSVTPGGYNPWLGFDSNVHGSSIRKYPNDFKKLIPDWSMTLGSIIPATKIYEWEWTLQRRMDANKNEYTTSYAWNPIKNIPESKALKLPDGTTTTKQRNNQKAGLNMEILRKWGDLTTGYDNINIYDGPNYIVMGTDPDEILYLNTTYKQKENGEMVVLSGEPWKYILPKEEGIPVINSMVTAYMRNREKVDNMPLGVVRRVKGSKLLYDGYEIQDIGTSDDNPNGTGTGNNKAPGIITVTAAGTTFKIKLNVNAPFVNDKGYYNMIKGPSWPAIKEKDVKYTLTGLEGLSISELNKYSLELSSQGTTGEAPSTKTVNLKDKTLTEKLKVKRTGQWTTSFDFEGYGYYDLSAYYKRTEDSDRVIIAGKEILDIQLRFLAVPGGKDFAGIDLKEGRGDGSYIYLEEYRNEKQGDFDTSRYDDKYVKSMVRTYTFNKGSQVTFETHDSDPHTFKHSGTEFYLSKRMQAKTIPNDSLKTSLAYYIDSFNDETKSFNENKTPSGYGKTFTHTWDTPGTYRLRAIYRGPKITPNNYVYQKVIITASKHLGDVTSRDLTTDEKKWLNVGDNSWEVTEVKNILSKFMYVDGPRGKNRFGKYNDFSRSFKWRTASSKNLNFDNYKLPIFVANWVNDFSYDNWFPKNWIRHYSGNMPADVEKNWIKPLEDTEVNKHIIALLNEDVLEDWQKRLPWISTTEYDGPRIRTNIKVLYNMKNFFDNDTGAFSGNPTIPPRRELNKFIMEMITDEAKNKLDFYLKLKHGELIITDKKTQTIFQVFNTDIEKKNPTLIYSDELNKEQTTSIESIFTPVRLTHVTSGLTEPQKAGAGIGTVATVGTGALLTYYYRRSIRRFAQRLSGAIIRRAGVGIYGRIGQEEDVELDNINIASKCE